MKDLQETLNDFDPSNTASYKQNKKIIITEQDKNLVEIVFENLAAIFPAWKSAFSNDRELSNAKLQWVTAFSENGVNTIQQLKSGFTQARKSDNPFMPSVGMFINWCRIGGVVNDWGSTLEIIRAVVQYHNEKKLSNGSTENIRPLIIEIEKRVDWWAMNQMNEKDAIKMVNNIIDKLIDENYIEPKPDFNAQALPTEQTVNENLSPEQQKQKQARGAKAMAEIKARLNKSKYKAIA